MLAINEQENLAQGTQFRSTNTVKTVDAKRRFFRKESGGSPDTAYRLSR
jgi:hypothetical protein